MRLAAALLLALAACKSATPSNEVTGTLTLEGATVTVTKCRPERGADGVYVVLETPKSALRFEGKKLWWNRDDPEGFAPGAALECKRLDRSWGGGSRLDGTSYWRGTLSFECSDGPKTATGDLTLDCGNITPEERASLDAQRTKLRDEQKAAGSGSAAP
ncbi:MAG: hypothetical protein H0T46_36710 [Deltaproteobacteria bacterium]|nr:hypothetical protein [Deltaproteobacteria bacterium]